MGAQNVRNYQGKARGGAGMDLERQGPMNAVTGSIDSDIRYSTQLLTSLSILTK